MGRGQTSPQTDKQTNGHRDSMTESAQWADSLKKYTVSYAFNAFPGKSGLCG